MRTHSSQADKRRDKESERESRWVGGGTIRRFRKVHYAAAAAAQLPDACSTITDYITEREWAWGFC